jgi:uncharacterized protein DUF4190
VNEQVPPILAGTTSTPKKSGFAIASLVLGILGMTCLLPIVGSILALVFGTIALCQISKSGGAIRGHGQAVAGLILGAVSLVILPFVGIFAAMLIPALSQARYKAREATCIMNVKQIGLSCALYADENNGKLPRKLDDLKPYTPSTKPFICPQASDITRYSYAFVGVTSKWQEDPKLIILREIEANHRGRRTVLFDDGRAELKSDAP